MSLDNRKQRSSIILREKTVESDVFTLIAFQHRYVNVMFVMDQLTESAISRRYGITDSTRIESI